MNFRRAMAATSRWWLVLVLFTIFGTGSSIAYAMVRHSSYSATASVFFALNRGATVSELAQGNTYTQGVVKSYSQVATLPIVLNPVISQLGLKESPEALARQLTVSVQADTVIADITVRDASPAQAARIANAVADQLGQAVQTLSPTVGTAATGSSATVRVITIAPAQAPQAPARTGTTTLAVAGLIGGLVCGIGMVILLERVRSPLLSRSMAGYVAPIVGRLARDPRARSHPMPVSTHPHLPWAESFRMLRTNLRRLEDSDEARCLAVVSPRSRDGRTSVAVNLAIAMCHSARNVLIIDADLRNPSVTSMIGVSAAPVTTDTEKPESWDRLAEAERGSRPGLADVLMGEATLDGVVLTWQTQTWREAALHILPAGRHAVEPSELLSQSAMADVLDIARSKYDVVIIDTPPVLAVTDGALIAAQADGALLVVNARRTREREFIDTVTALRLAGAKVRGTAFNQVRAPINVRAALRRYAPRRHTWKH